MKDLFFRLKHIFDAQSLILTPTRQLADYLRDTYDDLQKKSGETVWERLKVFSFADWISLLWKEFLKDEKLPSLLKLNETQSILLWEHILEKEQGLGSLAHLAQQAWTLSHQWAIDINDASSFMRNEDARAWHRWAQHFYDSLQDNAWIDSDTATTRVIETLKKTKDRPSFLLPQEIYLFNFQMLTAQQEVLLSALKINQTIVHFENFGVKHAQTSVMACQDEAMELETMVQWAKEQAYQGYNVGCVVPNLFEKQDYLTSLFKVDAQDSICLYSSQGKTLWDYPLIQHAVIALQSLQETILSESISTLLRSPYLQGYQIELSGRARLDKLCRRFGTVSMPVKTVTQYFIESSFAPLFVMNWQSFQQNNFPETTTHLPSEWAKYFQQKLSLLGWPGDRPLESEEYQLLVYWKNIIEGFSNLNFITSKISFAQALHYLEKMLVRTHFRQKTLDKTIIYLMDISDATGFIFDKLWVMGLHENALPALSSVNPFLPLTLQREAGVPQSSTDLSWETTKKMIRQLGQSAEEVILSYPLYEEESPLRPSALLLGYAIKAYVKRPDHADTETTLAGTRLESYEDIRGPLLDLQSNPYRSSQILKDQAACPFRAFARFRLGANALDVPQLGFSALQRGNFAHAVLEKIWKRLVSHTHLCQLLEVELITLIENTIDRVFIQFRQKNPFISQALFFQLEKKRLKKLILEWLTYEKSRQPFVVVATESRFEILLNGLPFHLRLDRMDKLIDGKYLLLDYKTSVCSLQDWLGESLDEPQLPLYYIASGISVEALAFAQVRTKEMRFKGYSRGESTVPGVEQKHDFNALVRHWEQQLEELAQTYLQGDAAVAPKYTHTCQFCDFSPLCRVKGKSETTFPSAL